MAAAARRSQGRAPRPSACSLARAVAVACAAAAVLAGCSAPGGAEGRPRRATSVSPRVTPPWTAVRVPTGATLVATARWRRISVFAGNFTDVRWRLGNPNALGAPLVFSVVGQRPGWLQVRVPARPNHSVGWIRSGDVYLAVDRYSIVVSLSRHRLDVRLYGRALFHLSVGVGRASAPTPVGNFFLTELLQGPTTTGPYGPYAYGTSAFSDVYSEFEGGPGQIGMHGTNDPSSVGANVSHGCIRLHNADITRLAHLVPVGSPITITP